VSLPTDSTERKNIPIARGVLDYFPDAVAEVARVSRAGNDQHNPGQPLHWAREKSTDHADCIARHLIERGTVDSDGQRHTAKLAWRALALLQTELEAAAATNPLGVGAQTEKMWPLVDVFADMLRTSPAYSGDGGGSVQQRAKTCWKAAPEGSLIHNPANDVKCAARAGGSCLYPFDHDPPCVTLPDDSILNDQRLFQAAR
jgi:hypothetical protein